MPCPEGWGSQKNLPTQDNFWNSPYFFHQASIFSWAYMAMHCMLMCWKCCCNKIQVKLLTGQLSTLSSYALKLPLSVPCSWVKTNYEMLYYWCLPTSKICPMQWELLISQKNWDSRSLEEERYCCLKAYDGVPMLCIRV